MFVLIDLTALKFSQGSFFLEWALVMVDQSAKNKRAGIQP